MTAFYKKGWMVRQAPSVLFRGELTSHQLSVRGQSAWQTSCPPQIASSSYRHTEAVCSASLMFVCSGLHFWVGFIGCFVLVHTWSHFGGRKVYMYAWALVLLSSNKRKEKEEEEKSYDSHFVCTFVCLLYYIFICSGLSLERTKEQRR